MIVTNVSIKVIGLRDNKFVENYNKYNENV